MSRRPGRPMDECPQCGAQFKRGRLACPECGSDAATGWQEDEEITYQSLEIPDAWPPDATTAAGKGGRWIVWVAALVVLALLLPYLIGLLS